MAREMPPWYIDKNVGIQHFKNDVSLSDEEIATIVQWVNSAPARRSDQMESVSRTGQSYVRSGRFRRRIRTARGGDYEGEFRSAGGVRSAGDGQ